MVVMFLLALLILIVVSDNIVFWLICCNMLDVSDDGKYHVRTFLFACIWYNMQNAFVRWQLGIMHYLGIIYQL
jgi:hypothetical protein